MAAKTKAQLIEENQLLIQSTNEAREQLVASAILGGFITALVTAVLSYL